MSNATYDPPDIAYIKMALDGFSVSGPECRMVKPHIADYHLLDPPVPSNPEELVEPSTEALRREVPKLIEELAIHRRELAKVRADLLDMSSGRLDDYLLHTCMINMHHALYRSWSERHRMRCELQGQGKMMHQDESDQT